MALTPEQRKILAAIKRVGAQRGASPKEVKAAIETGLVESNLRNLPGGDADSAGWRQERSSLYKNPTDLHASINRFFDETSRVKDKYGRAGDLAAAVQRPRADLRGKYQLRSGEAAALLGGGMGGVGASGPAAKPATTSSSTTVPDETARRQAVAQFLLTRHQDPNALLTAVSSLRDATKTETTVSRGMAAKAAQPSQPSPSGGGLVALGGHPGTAEGFRITGADPGRLRAPVVSFAKKVATIYGKPLTGDSGATHSRLTVDGNVSDHYAGNATDIPATGEELIRMGRAALIAAGMPRAQALKQTGGLFNVGGHQVIFNTHLGGDHTTHLHISAK